MDSAFLCSICAETLREPLTHQECGHNFCKLCLSRWFKELTAQNANLSCPQCRGLFIPLDALHINRALEAGIAAVRVANLTTTNNNELVARSMTDLKSTLACVSSKPSILSSLSTAITARSTLKKRKTALAKFAFDPVKADQLTLHKDEIVNVLNDNGNWWLVENNYGVVGKCPYNYLEFLPAELPATFHNNMAFNATPLSRALTQTAASTETVTQGQAIAIWVPGWGLGSGIYSGELVAGEPNGQGCIDFDTGAIYDGRMLNGLPDGPGTLYFPSGTLHYHGSWTMGLYEGQGDLYWDNGNIEYNGEFHAGKFEGKGKHYDLTGYSFHSGDFLAGRWQDCSQPTSPVKTEVAVWPWKERLSEIHALNQEAKKMRPPKDGF